MITICGKQYFGLDLLEAIRDAVGAEVGADEQGVVVDVGHKRLGLGQLEPSGHELARDEVELPDPVLEVAVGAGAEGEGFGEGPGEELTEKARSIKGPGAGRSAMRRQRR